jgi:hypothetical protein
MSPGITLLEVALRRPLQATTLPSANNLAEEALGPALTELSLN